MDRVLRRLITSALCLLAVAASKLPSAYDGHADGVVFNGHQNMPVTLYGVAIAWDRACAKGQASECLRLGQAFDSGLGDLRADPRVAIGYYIKACGQKAGPVSGAACASAAGIVREGRAGYTDPALAYRLADSGCTELKTPAACAALALQLYRGQGAPRDPARAGALWDAACKAGAEDGCRLQAGALFFESGDPAANRAAIALFEAGCKAGHAWGCRGLSEAYAAGKGVARDPAAAARYAETGCLKGDGDKIAVCGLHGGYLVRSGDKAQLNLGEKFLDRACMAGDPQACGRLTLIGLNQVEGATTTEGEAVFYARHACDLGYAQGCDDLGVIWENGMGGVPADPAVGAALREKACALGLADACKALAGMGPKRGQLRAQRPRIDPSLSSHEQLRLAQAEVPNGDALEGLKTVIRLMQEQNEDAEWLLGGWLYYGVPGLIDTSRKADGVVLIENAARVGHVDAAIWMGMAYWYGDGVPEDREKGETYMLIAAQRGSEEAAAIYRSMKAEPARVENARRAKEMAEATQRRQAEWSNSWSGWNASASSWTPQQPASNWQSYSQIQDQANFNNFVDSVAYRQPCIPGNPYC